MEELSACGMYLEQGVCSQSACRGVRPHKARERSSGSNCEVRRSAANHYGIWTSAFDERSFTVTKNTVSTV
jgi:hypothetical protein